ncbi:MAG: hypothetical protein Q4B22_09540 [Eubacteriales bacterium]|nr:hypothetical protein [Eubacteriales bacterium]
MSYGEILFYGGIALAGCSVLILLIGNLLFRAKKRSIRKKLYDRFGF